MLFLTFLLSLSTSSFAATKPLPQQPAVDSQKVLEQIYPIAKFQDLKELLKQSAFPTGKKKTLGFGGRAFQDVYQALGALPSNKEATANPQLSDQEKLAIQIKFANLRNSQTEINNLARTLGQKPSMEIETAKGELEKQKKEIEGQLPAILVSPAQLTWLPFKGKEANYQVAFVGMSNPVKNGSYSIAAMEFSPKDNIYLFCYKASSANGLKDGAIVAAFAPQGSKSPSNLSPETQKQANRLAWNASIPDQRSGY